MRTMRVTVGMIRGLVASRSFHAQILHASPDLEEEDSQQTLVSAAWRFEEIELSWVQTGGSSST